jgi:hypothetical protein
MLDKAEVKIKVLVENDKGTLEERDAPDDIGS